MTDRDMQEFSLAMSIANANGIAALAGMLEDRGVISPAMTNQLERFMVRPLPNIEGVSQPLQARAAQFVALAFATVEAHRNKRGPDEKH